MSVTAPLDVYCIMASSSSEINSTSCSGAAQTERMRDRYLWEAGNKRNKWER
ncbi:hypothetical protein A2U01_0071511, partial [Trifolium medium]|nr:hypothetical protein [Trifolium medium]